MPDRTTTVGVLRLICGTCGEPTHLLRGLGVQRCDRCFQGADR